MYSIKCCVLFVQIANCNVSTFTRWSLVMSFIWSFICACVCVRVLSAMQVCFLHELSCYPLTPTPPPIQMFILLAWVISNVICGHVSVCVLLKGCKKSAFTWYCSYLSSAPKILKYAACAMYLHICVCLSVGVFVRLCSKGLWSIHWGERRRERGKAPSTQLRWLNRAAIVSSTMAVYHITGYSIPRVFSFVLYVMSCFP